RLSFERAATFTILLAAGGLLALASAGRSDSIERILVGLVSGAVAVALTGLLVLAVSHSSGVEPATVDLPARHKGMGEDPNTASLLFALATPLALWFAVGPRSARSRLLAAGTVLLLVGSIVASGSHGALAGAAVGAATVAAGLRTAMRRRLLAVTTVAGVAALGLWIESLPQPS